MPIFDFLFGCPFVHNSANLVQERISRFGLASLNGKGISVASGFVHVEIKRENRGQEKIPSVYASY